MKFIIMMTYIYIYIIDDDTYLLKITQQNHFIVNEIWRLNLFIWEFALLSAMNIMCKVFVQSKSNDLTYPSSQSIIKWHESFFTSLKKIKKEKIKRKKELLNIFDNWYDLEIDH